MSKMLSGAACALVLSLSLLPASVSARDLTIGLAGDVTTIDPQFHNLGANNGVAQAIFDGIVKPDANMDPIPGLAESWKLINDTTWEFTLREGAKFHDGSPVTSEDVKFSIDRAKNMKDSPSGGFMIQVRDKNVEVVSERVFRVVTEMPSPAMLVDLTTVAILPKHVAEGTSREQFNNGKATIGAGPYKFVSWTPGDRIILERNPDYWGKQPDFDKVVIRPIPSAPTRVAALLSGDVDVIEQVPSTDLERLGKTQGIEIFQASAKRVMYLIMDQFRETTPDAVANDGSPIKNPLLDKNVRWALSQAISRDAIIKAVMNGAGEPARQYAPDVAEGASKTLQPIPYDPAGAKKLLADAGYPDGFKFKLHATNDRYPKDRETAEAIGQMFTRIGVKTEVVTLPGSVFFRRASSGAEGLPEFSMIQLGCCSTTGGAITPLQSLVRSYDKEKGTGPSNRGRYSNPEVDRLIDIGASELDEAKRVEAIAKATELAIADMAVIPLFFNKNIWATRGGVQWTPRVDDISIATDGS